MSRIRIDKYIYALLYEEVGGLCPLCSKTLLARVNGRSKNRGEAAHIYPHSPTPEQATLLKNQPRLSDDPESVENLILLCPSCHQDYDNPTTLENYKKLMDLKHQLLRRTKSKEYFNKHNIEEDIAKVLDSLLNIQKGDIVRLNYDVLNVAAKTKGKLSPLIQNIIESYIVDYFIYVQSCLAELEQERSGISNLIASEVKTYYLKLKSEGFCYKEIYSTLIAWLKQKTSNQYDYACEIIVCFYIQNCEVFGDDMPK